MRLFIGLGLPGEAREMLCQAVSTLPVRGQMTRSGNYHLTLAFLGEHEEGLQPLQSVIAEAAENCAPLTLTVTGFGFFGRRENALLYAKLRSSQPLQSLASSVRQLLADAGEPFDGKPFAAHITLMRKADLMSADLSAPFTPVIFPVNRLTLYHSARDQGILRYRPIYEAELREGNG